MTPILTVKGVSAYYKTAFQPEVRALENISLQVNERENLGIIGEIGSGKSTLTKLITALGKTGRQEGVIKFCYQGRLAKLEKIPNRYFRNHLQLVFQDCGLALNPKLKISRNLEEVYRINYKKKPVKEDIKALINSLALGEDVLSKYPADLSGGTQRRVFLGRALAGLGYLPDLPGQTGRGNHQFDTYPKLLILDELTRSLDAPLQHKIINFLAEVQPKLNLTYLIISHDFKIVCALCKEVVVLHRGRLVEQMSSACLREDRGIEAVHPYTKLLLGYSLEVKNLKNGYNLSQADRGCHYRPFCSHEMKVCSQKRPSPVQVNKSQENHLVACHLADM